MYLGNEYIVKQSKVIAPAIKELAQNCRDKKIPVIYCNDNWSQWQSMTLFIYMYIYYD